MSLAAFALWRYFVVLVFCLAAYVIGAAILRSVRFANRAEGVFFCTAFGLGFLSHLILLIGIAGWLTLTGVLIAIGFAVAASFLWLFGWENTSEPKKTRPQTRQGSWLITAFGILLVGVVLFQAWPLPLYPPTDFDTTMYHLAAPKIWLQAHAVTATPFLRLGIQPHSAHTLFAALMLAAGDIPPQILSFATAVLIGIGLYGWGQRACGQVTGLFAAALWAGSPVVLALAPVASYHMIASLFAFAAIYALTTYVTTRQRVCLFVSGAFMGFALSTWLWVILFLPVIALSIVWFAIKEKRVQPLWIAAAGLALAWSPALLRATWYTANPVYPLLTGVFGSGPWLTAQEIGSFATDIHRFGVPRTLLNFLLLPYTLVAHADKFQSRAGYSVALSLLFPVVAARAIFDKHLRSLGIVIVFFAGCWFFLGQIMRYLLPIIPLLCFVTAIAVVWLVDWACRGRRNVSISLTTVAALALLWPSLSFARKERMDRGSLPQTKRQREAYIALRIPEYRVLAIANALPAPLYSLQGANGAYYYEGLFMGDWFGPAGYGPVLRSLANGEVLWDKLHRLGARYFLVYFLGPLAPSVTYDDYFDSYFEPLFADSTAELYRLRDTPEAAADKAPNLLRDPGFDELRDNWPIAWEHFGKPLVGTPEDGASSGRFAVKVTDSDGLVQWVQVTPGNIYELELQAKTDQPRKLFRLQINWLDHQGQICGVFIRVRGATARWRSYGARMTAPDCATGAQIYASGQAGDSVWLDSFIFRPVKSQTSRPAHSSLP